MRKEDEEMVFGLSLLRSLEGVSHNRREGAVTTH